MDWNALSALSALFAAIGVNITVIYLAVQVRQNTREIRAASFNAVTSSFNAINLEVARDKELTRLSLRGMADYSSLNAEESFQFGMLVLSLFRVHESVYFQGKRGTLDGDVRDGEHRSLESLLATPGIREWWRRNPFSFTHAFRKHIDSMLTQTENSIARSAETPHGERDEPHAGTHQQGGTHAPAEAAPRAGS